MNNKLNALSDPWVVQALLKGEVGIVPTDTTYGLASLASNQTAVQRLYQLTGRTDQPGVVLAASVEQLVELGLKARYLKPVEHYWPNPITIIIPNYDLQYIHLGKGSVAVRIPADDDLQALLAQTGPLLTVGIEPENFKGQVDFTVEAGDLADRQPSTIIRIVDDAVEVLRQGSLKINEAGEIE